ncbi:MAG: type II secretion system F family protein [Candidatus Methanoperedens sp.]|nr:type II secretion system F family protein [Candidatus Methanoperedens sp.]
MNRFHKFAYILFGKYTKAHQEEYNELRLSIKQARIGVPWDIYVSFAYLSSLLTAFFLMVAGYMLLPLWRYLYFNYLKIAPYTGIQTISNYGEIIFSLVIILLISLVLGAITYSLIMAYPGLEAHNRKIKIDLTLAHTVAYMHALSKGGLSLISIFKSLGEHINVYGESAEEVAYIIIDTEIHGSDLITALKTAAVTTPSDKFRDFIDNLLNIMETGGDMETFFASMVSHYQKSAESDQNMHLEMLGMFAETYVTAFVAGPLFLITILIVMGITGPGSLNMLKVLIYAVIPLSAIAFGVLLSVISVGSEGRLIKIYEVSKKIRHYDDVRVKPVTPGEERSIRKLLRSLRWTSVVNVRKNPLKTFFSDPQKILYISVPVALIYSFLSIYGHEITITLMDDVIVISLIIILVPFIIFYEMQMKRITKIGESIPGFLRRLAAISEMGVPLFQAINSISKINLGVLSTEVKLMYKDIVWSRSLLEALTKFERRVNTIAISRIVTLITKASESTANIKDTLRVAASDSDLSEKLMRQKFTVLFTYLIVVYISFFVFMLVLYVFATMFLPQIPSNSGTSGMLSISTHKEEYSMLFMHASVIQGFFSGIIAGQMIGESPFDGLKHSMFMMITAYIFFVVFV